MNENINIYYCLHFPRMEKPAHCTTEVYLLMRDCWNFYPNQRPTFTEVAEDLQQILKISCQEEYLDLGLPALDTPPSSGETCTTLKDEEIAANLPPDHIRNNRHVPTHTPTHATTVN